MWPLSFIMGIHPQLLTYVLISTIVIAAAAFTATSKDALPAVSVYGHLRHACHSTAVFSSAVMRQKYESVVQGRLTWWDMVQFMALCTVIQGARIWRRRSDTQAEKTEIRDAGSLGYKTASSDRDLGSSASFASGKCFTNYTRLQRAC